MKKKTRIILAVLLVVIGINFNTIVQAGNQLHIKLQKLTQVIGLIEEKYVQIPDWNNVINSAIRGLMKELDPHSVYIEKKKLEKVEEQFEGEFEGIGIEFDILEGYITVISPIAGGPAEKAGIHAGDKIVEIKGQDVKGITKDEVYKKLRGPANSEVQLTIRRGEEEFETTVTRDEIPIYSVLASTILSDSTGYIHLNRFAETSSKEVEKSLDTLYDQGARQYILDLRNNSGGILQEAVEILDFFIEGRKKVVYTRGRMEESSNDYFAGKEYRYEELPLILLINRGSASASEVIAGAIQDFDRGLLIGERSFGKGLVQKQYKLNDGSAIRITIAKYYTPSGRLIQRPLDNGEEYYQNIYEENRDSILAARDSTKDSIRYETQGGREVYGGGGINPDYHIEQENELSSATQKLLRSPHRYIFSYSTNFIDEHREEINNKKDFVEEFDIKDEIYDDFKAMIQNEYESNIDFEKLDKNKQFLKNRIKAEIAKSMWGYDQYYKVFKDQDPYIQEALNMIGESEQLYQKYNK